MRRLRAPGNSAADWRIAALRGRGRWTSTLPGVDAGALAPMAGSRRGDRSQSRHDPVPRVGGIDNLVNLEHGSNRGRLAVTVELGDLGLVIILSFDGIGDGFHFLAESEANVTLKSHPPELAGRPGHREEGRVKAAANHGLRTQAVSLAQHDGKQRHGEAGAGYEHARDMAHDCRLLHLRPYHEAGRIAQRDDRNIESIAKLHESRGLVASRRINR